MCCVWWKRQVCFCELYSCRSSEEGGWRSARTESLLECRRLGGGSGVSLAPSPAVLLAVAVCAADFSERSFFWC